MARFYKTSSPTFVDDNIFNPPWELMARTIEAKEKGVDTLLGQTELLQGETDKIQHLNFESENERVKQLQNRYQTAIDDIAEKIRQNPLEYNRYTPAIKNLQKQMVEDKTTGDWYQIEQRYNTFRDWRKENEVIRKENPTLYNMLENHWYKDLVDRATEDSEASFRGQAIIDNPDLINSYREYFNQMKANSYDETTGRYKIGNKYLSESEVANNAWNTLMSDKNFSGYVNQMGNTLGLPGYVDEQGNPLNVFSYQNESGQMISPQEYSNLAPEERQNLSRVLNPESAFFPDIASVAGVYGFEERTLEEDQYGLIQARGEEQRKNMKFKDDLDRAMYFFKNPDQNVQVMTTENKQLFTDEELGAMGTLMHRLKEKQLAGKTSPEENAKLAKMESVYDLSLRSAGITDTNIIQAMRNTSNPEWGFGYKEETRTRITGSKENGDVAVETYNVKYKTEERKQAEALLERNKELIEKHNKQLRKNSSYNLSVIGIPSQRFDEKGKPLPNPVGDVLRTEFDILASGSYTTFDPNYLPFQIDGDVPNSVKKISPSVEGDTQDDYINAIASANGVKPSEVFIDGSLTRYERGGKIYYTGTINPEMIENAESRGWLNPSRWFTSPTLETPDGTDYNRVTVQFGENQSNVTETMVSRFRDNPEMIHYYNNARDNVYADIHSKVEYQVNFINQDMTKESGTTVVKGIPFKIPNYGNNLTIGYNKEKRTFAVYEGNKIIQDNLPSLTKVKSYLYRKSLE